MTKTYIASWLTPAFFLVVGSALSSGGYSIRASQAHALEVLPLSSDLKGVPGNSFVDSEGSVLTGFWFPNNDDVPYVVKVNYDLKVAWVRQFQVNVENPQALGAPVLAMRNERQPYVILPLAPYNNNSKPAGSQLVAGGSLAVFPVDAATAAFVEPALVVELTEPVASIDDEPPGPRCIYSQEIAGDILYCSLAVPTDTNSRLWKIEMSIDGSGKVLWERRPASRTGFQLFKSVAIAEDEAAENIVVAFAGKTSEPIQGVDELPSGEAVIGVELYNRVGARTVQSFTKANDDRSHANALAIGPGGLIILAEAPDMLHRLGLRDVQGTGMTLTKVWSAPNVNDNIVSIEFQDKERVLVAGSTTRLQAGPEGNGEPITLESPVVAVYNMSGSERFREVYTVHTLDETLRISSMSLIDASTGDAVVVGHSSSTDRSSDTAFLGTFRARTETEIATFLAASNASAANPAGNSSSIDASESEDRNEPTSSNKSMGVGIGVGIGVISLVILAALAILAKKQLQRAAQSEHDQDEVEDGLEEGHVPVAKNTLA